MRGTIFVALMFAALIENFVYAKDVPQLSQDELNAAYKAAGLTERNGKWLDACQQPTEPKNKVVDLNGDGQPEVFVLVSDSSCYGLAGAQLSLLIKDKNGRWKSNFGFPAGDYRVLQAKTLGYPDIEIVGPGTCFPVWRWNGKEYAIFKRCDR